MPDWEKLTRGVQRAGLGAFTEKELWTWEPHDGPAVPGLRGIFRDAHVEALPDAAELGVSSIMPSLSIDLATLGRAPTRGPTTATTDHFTRGRTGVRYRVVDVQPDGEGMLLVLLKVST